MPPTGAGAAVTADFTVRAEMGFSHRELLMGLPAAVAPYQIQPLSDLTYRLHHSDGDGGDERHILLTLQPEARRRIAAITLPLTVIKLEFFGFDQPRYQGFMRRYKRYLHKGGG